MAIHEAALVDYCRHVAAARDGPATQGGVVAVVDGPPGAPARAVRHAVAHAADRRRCGGTVHVRPDPESQRAQQARRCVVGEAVQVRGHLVGHAPGHAHLGLGRQTRRDHGGDQALHRLCREANGFRGVLVEGWNKGWDGDWFARGDEFSFTEPYADFDIVALAAYAKKKGVLLVGHHETAGNIAVYEKQLGAALDLYQKLGIDSVKTGYVADAGGVQALGARRTHSLRVARRAGAGASSPARGAGSGEAPHRRQSARAHQGHRACAARIPTGCRARARAAWNTTPGVIRRIRPNTR